MTKKKQLEIAFKKLIIEMLESINVFDASTYVIDRYVQKLLYEVSIRTLIK